MVTKVLARPEPCFKNDRISKISFSMPITNAIIATSEIRVREEK